MNKKKSTFPYLIGFSALLVAFASAFFSVFGLSQLFAGAKIQVIFMAGSLEFAKLVLASFLYRYWIKVNKGMKFYMSVAIIVLMIITSGGIYGYLSSAYQDTATKYEKRTNEITTLNQKKVLDSIDVSRLQDRYNTLTNLRQTQETRLDTLYNRKQNVVAKRTEDLINKTNNEISQLDSNIRVKNDKINEISSQVLSINSENISGEIGPLKYLSDLTGLPMNKVVNIFILLLIFVFDPLAVTMIIGANIAFKQNEEIEENNEHHEEPISKMWSWLKKKPKPTEELQKILENPTDDIIQTFVQKEIDEVRKEQKQLPDGLVDIPTMIENQKPMPKEFVDALNNGYWDLIDNEFEEKHKNQKFMTLDGGNFETNNNEQLPIEFKTDIQIEKEHIDEVKKIEKEWFVVNSEDLPDEPIDKQNIEELMDSVEKQIEENRNHHMEDSIETPISDNINIYGENITNTTPEPQSEYFTGGGIKWSPK